MMMRRIVVVAVLLIAVLAVGARGEMALVSDCPDSFNELSTTLRASIGRAAPGDTVYLYDSEQANCAASFPLQFFDYAPIVVDKDITISYGPTYDSGTLPTPAYFPSESQSTIHLAFSGGSSFNVTNGATLTLQNLVIYAGTAAWLHMGAGASVVMQSSSLLQKGTLGVAGITTDSSATQLSLQDSLFIVPTGVVLAVADVATVSITGNTFLLGDAGGAVLAVAGVSQCFVTNNEFDGSGRTLAAAEGMDFCDLELTNVPPSCASALTQISQVGLSGAAAAAIVGTDSVEVTGNTLRHLVLPNTPAVLVEMSANSYASIFVNGNTNDADPDDDTTWPSGTAATVDIVLTTSNLHVGEMYINNNVFMMSDNRVAGNHPAVRIESGPSTLYDDGIEMRNNTFVLVAEALSGVATNDFAVGVRFDGNMAVPLITDLQRTVESGAEDFVNAYVRDAFSGTSYSHGPRTAAGASDSFVCLGVPLPQGYQQIDNVFAPIVVIYSASLADDESHDPEDAFVLGGYVDVAPDPPKSLRVRTRRYFWASSDVSTVYRADNPNDLSANTQLTSPVSWNDEAGGMYVVSAGIILAGASQQLRFGGGDWFSLSLDGGITSKKVRWNSMYAGARVSDTTLALAGNFTAAPSLTNVRLVDVAGPFCSAFGVVNVTVSTAVDAVAAESVVLGSIVQTVHQPYQLLTFEQLALAEGGGVADNSGANAYFAYAALEVDDMFTALLNTPDDADMVVSFRYSNLDGFADGVANLQAGAIDASGPDVYAASTLSAAPANMLSHRHPFQLFFDLLPAPRPDTVVADLAVPTRAIRDADMLMRAILDYPLPPNALMPAFPPIGYVPESNYNVTVAKVGDYRAIVTQGLTATFTEITLLPPDDETDEVVLLMGADAIQVDGWIVESPMAIETRASAPVIHGTFTTAKFYTSLRPDFSALYSFGGGSDLPDPYVPIVRPTTISATGVSLGELDFYGSGDITLTTGASATFDSVTNANIVYVNGNATLALGTGNSMTQLYVLGSGAVSITSATNQVGGSDTLPAVVYYGAGARTEGDSSILAPISVTEGSYLTVVSGTGVGVRVENVGGPRVVRLPPLRFVDGASCPRHVDLVDDDSIVLVDARSGVLADGDGVELSDVELNIVDCARAPV